MTNTVKAALIGALSALIILFVALIAQLQPTLPDPTPSPSVVVEAPSQVPVNALVLDSFERPEFALPEAFKASVTRTILGGAVTGFAVIATDPCTLTVQPAAAMVYKMVPTVTTVASSSAVVPGTFYDALVPLNSDNCLNTKYVWVDLTTGTYDISGAKVTVLAKGTLPTVPTKPMLMLMSNTFLTRGHYFAYQNGSEALGVPYLKEMVSHRLHPYGSYVSSPPVVGGKLDLFAGGANSYQKNVIDFASSYTWLPNFSTAASLQAANATALVKPWLYTKDEPAASEIEALKTTLAFQNLNAPGIKRMVTTVFRSDLDADIFVPVAEQFDLSVPKYAGDPTYPGESAYAAKELWLYVSCMSHGCSTDLNANTTAAKVSGSDTGAPDLTLDRSGAEPFGYMLLAQKYPSVKALLYYNTVEQYKLVGKGFDMWKGETFNFGGNLDGTLFWPGRPGIEGLTAHVPVVSVRMKLLREAQNLADLLSMLDQTWVKTQVGAIMTGPTKWTRSAAKFDQLQREAIGKL